MARQRARSRFFEACWETELRQVLGKAANAGGIAAAIDCWKKAIVEANWFRQALANVRIGLAAQDSSLRYVWVFKPFGPMPGEAMLGRRDTELLPPGSAAQLTAFKRRILTSKKGARENFTIPTLEGDLAIDVRCEPVLDVKGAALGLLCAAIDLTAEVGERRRLVISREKAEAALFAKNRSIARASHDLRQPFQAMRVLHEALRLSSLGDRERLIVETMGEAMRSGEALLSSLLEFSVMDTRLQVVQLEDFPLQDIFDALKVEACTMAGEKGLDCRVVSTSVWVMSDRVLLTRMLRNLLVNSVRYTRRGKILLGCRQHQDEVEIQIFDTGIGIPEDQTSLIFEDFYRTDEGSTEAGGLGLGLANVARISTMLAHPVTVRSQPGRGSVFSVHVPKSATEG